MLNNYPTPDVVLESERAIIVASRENALRYVNENQDKVLQAIDKAINAQDNILMLTKDEGYIYTNSRSQHKILITETDAPDPLMYTTNYRTVFNKDVMGNILTEKGFSVEGWGPWHELGHMHQQQAWRWSSITEVQVNIFFSCRRKGDGNLSISVDDVGAILATRDKIPEKNRRTKRL
ncbi:hypothetical protein CTZ24_24015 (plasmid) [Pantoea phytobeneficialis]|nr:hypothetical protein CTZ24_24015 [Pantoea phytobeneficialis]